ncbi:hypothetical protein GCM10010492_34320 [Saccharothrix mutabilis subsp. mutabilis]|uniref:Uncharacterized protein n=1 Tax=Saccharothrix mutabilis subsp. mutabilis TaxID=66855 RepID=A0ABN0TXQ6_9PSEU
MSGVDLSTSVPVDRLRLTRGPAPVTATVSCEAMTNLLPTIPVDPRKGCCLAQDAQGNPLVFTLGEMGQLWLHRFRAGHRDGWRRIHLGNGYITSEYTARGEAFDVVQDSHGRITLAVALRFLFKDGTSALRVYATGLLPPDTSDADWEQLPERHLQRVGNDQIIPEDLTVEHVRLGNSEGVPVSAPDAGGQGPVLAVVGKDSSGAQIYVEADPTAGSATRRTIPEDMTSVSQVAVGHHNGMRAVWLLGTGKSIEGPPPQRMYAVAVGKGTKWNFSPGSSKIPKDLRYTCVTPITYPGQTRALTSDVYVGTADGVRVFLNGRGAPLQLPVGLKDVRSLVVNETHHGGAKTVAVWALCGPEGASERRLHYVRGTRTGNTLRFTRPVLLRQDVAALGASRNRAHPLEMMIANTAGELTHVWQDPTHGMWHTRPVGNARSLPEPTGATDFATLTRLDAELVEAMNKPQQRCVESYTSVITLTNDHGTPLADKPVTLRASQHLYVLVDNHMHLLSPDAGPTLHADADGKLTVVAVASGATPAALHLTSPAFPGRLIVRPSGKAYGIMRAITSEEDLRGARDNAGNPIIGADVPQETVLTAAGLLPALSTPARGTSPDPGCVHTRYEPTPSSDGGETLHAFTTSVKVKRVQGDKWTLETRGTPFPVPLPPEPPPEPSDIFEDAYDWACDRWEDLKRWIEELKKDIDKAAEIVCNAVEEGIDCVVKIGEEVFRFALKTAAQVLKAVNSLLKLIGIDLLAWIRQALGWDDIVKIADATASGVTECLTRLSEVTRSKAAGWKSRVNGWAGDLNRKLEKAKLPDAYAGKRLSHVKSEALASAIGVLGSAPVSGLLSPAMRSLMDSFQAGIDFGPVDEEIDAMGALVGDTLAKIAAKAGAEIIQDWQALADNPDFKTIGAVYNGMISLAQECVALAAELFCGLIDHVPPLLSGMVEVLGQPFDNPWVQAILDFLDDLGFPPPRDRSVVGVFALAVAIPAAQLSRALTGSRCPADIDLIGKRGTWEDMMPTGGQSPHVAADAWKPLVWACGCVGTIFTIGGGLFSAAALLEEGKKSGKDDGFIRSCKVFNVFFGTLKAVYSIPGVIYSPNLWKGIGWVLSAVSTALAWPFENAKIKDAANYARAVLDACSGVAVTLSAYPEHCEGKDAGYSCGFVLVGGFCNTATTGLVLGAKKARAMRIALAVLIAGKGTAAASNVYLTLAKGITDIGIGNGGS